MYYSSACKIIWIENWEGEGFIKEKSLKKMLVPRGVHRNIFFAHRWYDPVSGAHTQKMLVPRGVHRNISEIFWGLLFELSQPHCWNLLIFLSIKGFFTGRGRFFFPNNFDLDWEIFITRGLIYRGVKSNFCVYAMIA